MCLAAQASIAVRYSGTFREFSNVVSACLLALCHDKWAWAAEGIITCKRIISRELEQSVFQLVQQALLLGSKA
eukprot:2192873-Rhodomonas_salina.1